MNTKMVKNAFILLPLLLITLVASCVSTGTSRLTKNAVEKVREGDTTKEEIANLLGQPEQMLKLDKESLNNYISRVLLEGPPESTLPEGEYEVWTYSQWSYFDIGPILFPSSETLKFCIFVMNRDDICVKKFYAKQGELRF
jgi:hypothetical protein